MDSPINLFAYSGGIPLYEQTQHDTNHSINIVCKFALLYFV